MKEAVGAPITPLKKTLPLAYRLQRAIFGHWEKIDDGQVVCPHCGSSLLAGKENTPRSKKYCHPETGEWCQTVDTVLWGVMVHLHLCTTYRRAADVWWACRTSPCGGGA